ncbi:MAG: phytanoyl-CoA dioxygenase family protein [Rhodospirillales bacterium]|nr:phytanoyl-CoA dioxygenase family protein [Rhodospirillales bacterium]
MMAIDLAGTYATDGVVHVKGVLDAPWIARLAAAVDRAMAAPGRRAIEFQAPGEPGRFFGDMFMHRRDPDFRAAFFETRCAALAGEAMGARQVHLFYDQIFAKEPGTPRRTPWHQDFPYWPATGDMFCTVYLALDAIDAQNGGVEYVAGSHRWGPDYCPQPFRAGGEGAERYRNPAFAPAPDIDALRDTLDIRRYDMAPGDAVVFHGKLVHGAGGNDTPDRRRRTVALRFAGEDARWREGVPTFKALNAAKLKTGDRLDARADLFPVVWRRP